MIAPTSKDTDVRFSEPLFCYHFDSNGYCTNPNNESGFDSDYQSILNQEQLEAQKRLLDQGTSTGNAYEENIVYEHDAAPQPIRNRFPLADMQF